jgi:hypothetical protein
VQGTGIETWSIDMVALNTAKKNQWGFYLQRVDYNNGTRISFSYGDRRAMVQIPDNALPDDVAQALRVLAANAEKVGMP